LQTRRFDAEIPLRFLSIMQSIAFLGREFTNDTDILVERERECWMNKRMHRFLNGIHFAPIYFRGETNYIDT
jgi:hypothetical protein